jgi:hypothetical protein
LCSGARDYVERASTLPTVWACQRPPRAVATPRAFSAAAMARNDLAPARCISRMSRRTFAAGLAQAGPALRLSVHKNGEQRPPGRETEVGTWSVEASRLPRQRPRRCRSTHKPILSSGFRSHRPRRGWGDLKAQLEDLRQQRDKEACRTPLAPSRACGHRRGGSRF